MWELGSRSVIVLVSVLSGCVFLYNVWGPIFILIVLLFLTIYACYFLIVNDVSLLSPRAFILLEHCKYITLEVRRSFKAVIDRVHQHVRQFLETAKRRFRQRYLAQASSTMERRRSGLYYQLSTDSYPTRPKNASHLGSIAQLSPIPKSLQKPDASNDVTSRNHFYQGSSEHLSYDHHSFVSKRTSTPVFTRNKEELENQTLKFSPPGQERLPNRASPLHKQHHQALMQVENTTYFDAEGSSLWSSAPPLKTNSKAGERKAVQTVAGPLLTSTRYNIDPKVYNDVTSPGLTARLTKYATEASNKLTHQSKYRVGQFPKVNLHASSVPVINVKSMRTRTPATVNVAPSHAIRYSSPSKQNILSNLRHSDDSYSSPNVAQALREISLKRHASREDVVSDFAKKQRRDVVPSSKEFEAQDEVKQKRSRDDSLKSEDDTSPQSKIVRPAKRTKAPSCYDIINSLSSSKHVVSGVKRKAIDFSRSGTPDFEKHFKSLECVQNASTQTSVQQLRTNTSPKHPNYELSTERRSNSVACNSLDKLQEHTPLKGILKTSNKSKENESDRKHARRLNVQSNSKSDSAESVECTESAKLTDKLFMRAEPERNEKLRLLVEEQGNIRAKFTTDDVEEIKKEDITDMRQTSMKARLQSMFDAISGKAASRINPDVVIQAEEVNTVKSVASPVTYVSLNSSTTTTNVNTTPISTSAVALTPGSSESNTKSPKHVAFNLPGKDTGVNATNVQYVNTFEKKIESTSTVATDKPVNAGITFTSTKSESVVSSPATTNSTSSSVQNVNFDKATSSSMGNRFTVDTVSAKNKSPLLAVSTTASSIFQSVATAASTAICSAISVSTTAANARNEPSQSSNSRTNVSQAAGSCSSTSSVSTESMKGDTIFASSRTNLATTLSNATEKKEQKPGFASIAAAKASVMPFTSATSSSNVSNMNTSTPSKFTFGSNSNCPSSIVHPAKSEGFVFGSIGSSASQNSGAFGCSTATSRPTSMIPNSATPSSIVTVASASNAGFEAQAKNSGVSIFGSSINSTFALRPSTTLSANGGKAVFSFGNASTTTTAAAATTTTITTTTTNTTTISSNAGPFGVGGNNPPPSFGTSSLSSLSTTSTTNQAVSNASSIFTNASSTPSIFGATTASHQPVFGTSSNLNANAATFALAKSTATPVFGSNLNTNTTSSSVFASTSAIPIFSNIAGACSVNTTSSVISMPVFGSSTSSTAPSGINTGGSNLFSSTNSTTSASVFSTTNNIFGQANSSTDSSFKSGTGLFRNNNNSGGSTLFAPSSVQPSTTSTTFGTANVPNNPTVSTFGSHSNVPASNNAPVPVFGAAAAGTPDFASQGQNKGNQGTTNQQHAGPTSQSFAAGGTSIFRTAENTTTVFASSNDTAGHFNSPVAAPSSNTFVGQNVISPNPTFGSIGTTVNANGPPPFNDSNKASPFATAQQSSTFGTPTMASTSSVFANVNTNESNAVPGIFTFGASQKPPPQQNTTTFSFGGSGSSSSSSNNNNNNSSNNNNNNNNSSSSSNNNSCAASTSVPFQFGSTTSNSSATGFNFSAPTTTPSINFGTTSSTTAFNASTPGMFSIGSGSTAPRSRNIRTRKLR